MPNHNPSELGDLEREVLQLVWRLGPVTAEKVRSELRRPLKASTVRTILLRLEEKGYLSHTVEGRTFVYQAAEPPRRTAARAVRRIAEWFCDGSVAEVVAGLVDARMLDPAQLKRLGDQIAKARKKSRT